MKITVTQWIEIVKLIATFVIGVWCYFNKIIVTVK